MKILIFNWRDIKNPEAGGAEVYTHEITKRLVNKGHRVVLVTAGFKGTKEEEIIDGVYIFRVGNKYSVYWRAKEFYLKNLAQEGFDVLVDEINTRPFFCIKFAKNGTRVVALIHQLAKEFWFYEMPFPLSLVGYFLEKYWLYFYRKVPTVTVSPSTRKDLERWGFQNIKTVPNGINVEPVSCLPVKNSRPTIIFVGRMKRAKKPQDVLKAFEMVRKKIGDAELWMVGDGYMRERLKARKPEGVKFWGYLAGEKKNELVKKAWVIAVAGVREGWGQVVTDANALGTPAVGYNIPGLRDSIKDGYNGLLVNPDPRSLAEGLITLLKDAHLREKLSRNAIEWAKQFSWDKSAEEFERILKQVVNSE